MFAKSILATLSIFAVAYNGVAAKPIALRPAAELTRRTSEVISPPSFNNYLGLNTMSNFDDFFGQDNFDSSFNEVTIIEQQEEIVCSSQEIQIVQQRLSILLETAKRVIIEQICEVEVQTVVIQQFQSVFSSFSNSVLRQSDSQVSFDQNISGMLSQLLGSDGSLSSNDLGFSGKNVGSHSVSVGGNNWNNDTSPSSVQKAYDLANSASNSTGSCNPSLSNSNSTVSDSSSNSTVSDSSSNSTLSSNSTSSS